MSAHQLRRELEASRPQLRAVAFRMLGSPHDASRSMTGLELACASEASRSQLRAVALRMLGSLHEAGRR